MRESLSSTDADLVKRESSMKATIHNLHTERMEDGDVYIGRAGKGHDGYFGNPYQIGERIHGIGPLSRALAIDLFENTSRDRMTSDAEFRERVKALHGKRLFCFCAPKPCHGDVLARLAAELQDV